VPGAGVEGRIAAVRKIADLASLSDGESAQNAPNRKVRRPTKTSPDEIAANGRVAYSGS
jgi:hypothetical protein